MLNDFNLLDKLGWLDMRDLLQDIWEKKQGDKNMIKPFADTV